ncbi:MAG: prefoldin subunit alpha [Candidatus Micrarchaeota archaeon]|nr:prefoldin subunit alpha [Candidatus Micrarchaeota archaeon]
MAEEGNAAASMDPRELLGQLQYLQQIYSQQYQALEDNIATYTIAQSSLRNNIELLGKSDMVKGTNILIDCEGGTYIDGRIADMKRVLVYIGAGYMVEKKVPQAIEFLKENEAKGEQLLNRLTADKRKVEGELIEIAYKMTALQQQLAGSGIE